MTLTEIINATKDFITNNPELVDFIDLDYDQQKQLIEEVAGILYNQAETARTTYRSADHEWNLENLIENGTYVIEQALEDELTTEEENTISAAICNWYGDNTERTYASYY